MLDLEPLNNSTKRLKKKVCLINWFNISLQSNNQTKMKRRNFLVSLGLVAGVSAVAKADKQSYIPLNSDGVEHLNLSKDGDELVVRTQGVERMRITSSGNIGISTGGSSLPKKLNVVGVIGNTPS